MIRNLPTKNSKAFRGFTILELVIAMAIVVLFFGTAAIFAIQRGNEDLMLLSSDLRTLASESKEAALQENRSKYIIFTPTAIWQSNDPDSEFDNGLPHLSVKSEFTVSVRLDQEWITLNKDNPKVIWLFSSSGLCEQISLKLEADDASYEYDFHPLTAQIILDDSE